MPSLFVLQDMRSFTPPLIPHPYQSWGEVLQESGTYQCQTPSRLLAT